jgi:hypothetical protein
MSTVLDQQPLTMHPRLLGDIIKKQAGTLAKGCLEGASNTVDANATKCEMHLDADVFRIFDDGQGFSSVEQIRKCFGTFGQPHEESEKKVYGTFRMGRGQMFAFGKNTWRTGTFQMVVDINNSGFSYDLTTDLPFVQGCHITIELYKKLDNYDIQRCVSDLKNWLRYAPIPMFLNGDLITIDPSTETWDSVTPDAYVRLNNGDGGGLSVYNLGMHVMTVPSYSFGAGGTVVSRKQLRVNFARNDIQHDCEVWNRVKLTIENITTKRLSRAKTLNAAGRKRIADKLCAGLLRHSDVDDAKLITAVTGRHYTIAELGNYTAVTVARDGDRRGDWLHRQGNVFVIAESTLSRFGVTSAAALMDRLESITHSYHYSQITKLDYYLAISSLRSNFDLLPPSKLNKAEKVWLRLLTNLVKRNSKWESLLQDRTIRIGDSDTASAWTDASTYIAFSRCFLAKQAFDPAGIGKVLAVLLHECCHVTPDNSDHDHDQAFYEMYHDHADAIAPAAYKMLYELPAAMEYADRKVPKSVLKRADIVRDNEDKLNELKHEMVSQGFSTPTAIER